MSNARAPLRWAWPLGVVLVVQLAAACGSGDGPKGSLGPASVGAGPGGGSCAPGATRDCSVKVAEHMGIVHCYLGTETCGDGGTWGACTGGDMVAKVHRDGMKAYALSTPGSCADPCDPSCQEWIEVPNPSFENAGLPTWSSGGSPPPAGNLGEPCIDAFDCQANHKCLNPEREREPVGELVNDGVVVRYFLDEAASGTAPTTVYDAAANPLDLTVTAAPELSWTEAGTGRGLRWANAGGNGRASVGVNGTKIFNALNGSTTITLEAVFDVDAVSGGGTPLINLGPAASAGDFELVAISNTTLEGRYEGASIASWNVNLVNSDRMVAHLVLDSSLGTAVTRLRLYVDGVLQIANAINSVGAGDTFGIGPGRSFVIGNRQGGGRSPRGVVSYAALYSTAFTAAQVRQNAAVLDALDDATAEHPKCETGSPLLRGSDRCVAAVCAANPMCCEQKSDCHTLYGSHADVLTPGVCSETADTCHMALRTNTGTSCAALCASGGGTCVEMYDNASDIEVCAANPGTAAGCNSTVMARGVCVCTKPGAGAWDAACVQAVHTECGAFCGTPPREDGECVMWAPGETDADCGGVDLTIAASCTGTIAVCNVGNSDAPAGVELVHFDGADDQFPSCAPNTALPSAQTCTTADVIEPGACIDVTSCMNLGAGTGLREVMVNPAGTTAECHNASCMNNWLLHDDGLACGSPSCETTFVSPSSCTFDLPDPNNVDPMGALTVTYDNSLTAATLVDVGSAGGCTANRNEYYLDDPAAPTQVTLCPNTCTAVTTQADTCAGTNERYDAATETCYLLGTNNVTWNAARTACQSWGGDLAAVGSAAENAFITGFLVNDSWLAGTDSVSEGTWRWATGDPWTVGFWNANEPNDAGGEDCLEINLGGGWNDETCVGLQDYVCERDRVTKTLTIAWTCLAIGTGDHTLVYDSTCASGEQTVWGLLAWDTDVEGDANIVWEVRTADDVASLAGASWVVAGTATTANEVCSMTPENPPSGFPPPPGSCPVDLFGALAGVPEATRDVLELRITLNPSTNGAYPAQVNSWQLRHSCVAAE